jgi:MFS family permease
MPQRLAMSTVIGEMPGDTVKQATGTSVVVMLPVAETDLLAIPHFRILLLVQVLFWSSSAVFLMLPKYLALQLHANALWIGLIMGGMGVGSVAMAPMIASLTRWSGRRRCVVLASVMMACGGLLYVWVDAPGPLAVLARCLQGMAGALLYAHGTVMVADLVPRSRLPSAIALYMTAGLVPNVVSPPAAEWLLAQQGPDLVFATAGLLALAGAALAMRLPDQTHAFSDLPAVPKNRPATSLLAVSALFGLAAGITFTFHQPLALERGAQRVSDFLITFTITATVLRLAGGRFIDRLGSVRVACWSGAGYALVMLALAAHGPAQLALLGACFGATHGLFFPTFVALVLHHGPDAGRETRMAWIGASDKFGYLLVIPLGLLADRFGYAILFVLAAVLLATAVLILRRVLRTW